MKYLVFIFLFCMHLDSISQSNLNSNFASSHNRTMCDSIDNPFIYSGQCDIGIGRILAKNVATYGLSQYNNSDPCYGDVVHHDSLYNCDPPYNLCFGKCSIKYWEIIKGAVDLEATLLVRAGSIAGKEFSFHNDTISGSFDWRNYSYAQCQQLVKDVNRAFDCAGLPRPVIQGEILELPINFHSSDIRIPQYVIDSFIQEMSGLELSYYSIQRFFNWQRMKLIDTSSSEMKEYQNIDSIESRMWFYYVSTKFIDMGYKAIHMGIYPTYANKISVDPGYIKLGSLTSMIREYATSQGTFVLLNGETGLEDSPKIGNSDQLIFDFDSRAIRPHEIESYDSGDFGCNQYIHVNGTVFDSEPCDSENYPAIIDTCVINQFGGSVGGISPTGCVFENVPYILHWDFGSGILGELENDSCFVVDSNVFEPTSQLTFGFEDTRWFGELLTSNCKSEWLKSMYCQFRNQRNNDGYLMMPLLIPMKYQEEYDYDNCQLDSIEPIADGAYMMTDDSLVLSDISMFLKPQIPYMVIDSVCDDISYCSFNCNDYSAPPRYRYRYGYNVYKFTVGNDDCTSLYSWHIYNLKTNQWLPQSLGKERKFTPPNTGNYIIILRQDNVGIEPYTGSYGVFEIRDTLYLYPKCCDDIVPIGQPCRNAIVENSLDKLNYEDSKLEYRQIIERKLIRIQIYNSLGQIYTSIEEEGQIQEIFHKLGQECPPGIYFISKQYSDGSVETECKTIMRN